jgi:hypothetical protein
VLRGWPGWPEDGAAPGHVPADRVVPGLAGYLEEDEDGCHRRTLDGVDTTPV